MCRKHQNRTWRSLVDLLNKNCATPFERLHHVLVVNYLFAHVNWGTVVIKSFFNCNYGPINSCTITSRCGE